MGMFFSSCKWYIKYARILRFDTTHKHGGDFHLELLERRFYGSFDETWIETSTDRHIHI